MLAVCLQTSAGIHLHPENLGVPLGVLEPNKDRKYPHMPLTNLVCKNTKPTDRPIKLADSGGLFLHVKPNGGKYWRLKYRFMGKEKLLALGVYPEVSLEEAREQRTQAKKILASGQDPADAKKQEKRLAQANYDNSFERIAHEWYATKKDSWTPNYASNLMKRLEADIFPPLGNRPIGDITARELLDAIRKIEARGAVDIAKRALQVCGQIFRYAVIAGFAERDPSSDLKGALKTVKSKSHAHLKEDELPEYLAKLESYDGHPLTVLALRFLLLTFVRSAELREATWTEINWDKAEWRIPAERMKMREQHVVPLSSQSLAILWQIQERSGNRKHLFPNQHHPRGCMSENTLLYSLYRMGYHSRATAHGFRSTASTILNENGFRPDVIERQLAHSERNSVRAAYNHAEYLPERRDMMQWWGNYVEKLMPKQSHTCA